MYDRKRTERWCWENPGSLRQLWFFEEKNNYSIQKVNEKYKKQIPIIIKGKKDE